MTNRVKELAKKILFRHTNFAVPKYEYCVEPIQLAEIVKGLDSVIDHNRDTCLVEIGVARGLTSRFLVEHIKAQKYKTKYYCMDTFSSFTKEDVDFEVKERGKMAEDLIGFGYNDYDVWRKNFKDFPFVKPIKCDCSDFDFSSIEPVDFCFLDVDLYIPTKNVLNNIWSHLSENALIIVDDVLDRNEWDGAYQAFMEFVNDNKLDYKLVGNKCGIIRKQPNNNI